MCKLRDTMESTVFEVCIFNSNEARGKVVFGFSGLWYYSICRSGEGSYLC